MPPPEKLKPKLLTPEKLKQKLLTPSQMRKETDEWMDRGNTICPFHHSLNGRGSKNINVSENTLATTVNKFIVNELVQLTML